MATPEEADPVEVLRRWEESGAVWRVLSEGAGHVTVGLLTCDGGEEVARLSCQREVVAPFLAGRVASDETAV